MRVIHSKNKRATHAEPHISAALDHVSQDWLRRTVETLSEPRHYQAEPASNRRCAQFIADELGSFGYVTRFQGPYKNVVAIPATPLSRKTILVGTHYDTVPGSPGADDNASGVAALLECARVSARLEQQPATVFVAFNCEEAGRLGSVDFVANDLPNSIPNLEIAYILEMVGYCSRTPGSQLLPKKLPIRAPSVGDFIGILGNRKSNHQVDSVLTRAATYVPELPVLGLKIHLGLEKHFPVLRRSDHDPFWQAGIPAMMWTDTAEFRNPNYHQQTDTPNTLDYAFLRSVTQLLLSCVLGDR